MAEKTKTIIKTFKDLREIDTLVGELYTKDFTLKGTKFGYAYKKFAEKNYTPTFKLFKEELDDVRLTNALEDLKTREILLDENPQSRGYKYDKEGLKQCIKAEKEIIERYNAKEIKVEPFISPFKPELTMVETEMLKGLLI